MAPATAPAPASTARWGLRFSLLTGAVAALLVAFQLKQNPDLIDDETVYCYQGVKTEAFPENVDADKYNCFGVSPSTGLFTRVFESSSASAETIRKGYALPGLWDGHGHLLQYGEFLHSADLFGSDSFDEIRDRLKGYLDANPGSGSRDNWFVYLWRSTLIRT